tara:strand:+ start:1072 stop:1416 length:345 start_codon:yes stop_codon:yes gene_type:complete
MKKLLASLFIMFAFTVPASAWDFGNSVEAKYNVDQKLTTITMESGVTQNLSDNLVFNINADFNLKEINNTSGLYQGLDIGVDYNIADNVMFEVDTGIDTDWKREDISVSMTWTF